MDDDAQIDGFAGAEEPPDETTLRRIAGEEFCYLTTTGRVTGQPHEIEIWFALIPESRTAYFLSGGRDRSDWVKNLRKEARVTIRVADLVLHGTARHIEDGEEASLARDMLVKKYEREPGGLTDWRRESLPVAVDIA